MASKTVKYEAIAITEQQLFVAWSRMKDRSPSELWKAMTGIAESIEATQKELTKEIEVMVEKAAKAEKSDDALKFSQAACNAANAINCVKHWPKDGD